MAHLKISIQQLPILGIWINCQSALTTVQYETKFFRLSLRVALIYGYKHKCVESSLTALIHKNLKLGSMYEREHAAFVFLSMSYLTSSTHFSLSLVIASFFTTE